MSHFRRSLCSLAAVLVVAALAILVPAAGPYLLALTAGGTVAAYLQERTHAHP